MNAEAELKPGYLYGPEDPGSKRWGVGVGGHSCREIKRSNDDNLNNGSTINDSNTTAATPTTTAD